MKEEREQTVIDKTYLYLENYREIIRECRAETVILFEHLKKALTSLKEEVLSAFEALYKVREPERSNNWRKYHGLPLKRRGGKRSGRKKGNDRTAKNADVS